MHSLMRLLCTLLIAAVACGVSLAWSQDKSFVVAVVTDGENLQSNPIDARMTEELDALVEGEFDIRYKQFRGDWPPDQ